MRRETKGIMKRMKAVCAGISCLFLLFTWMHAAHAQESEKLALQIRLRAGDGAAISGEPVSLQRMPAEDNPVLDCITDANGSCAWQVERGLYQLLLERPLDNVSALALAEGGLRGFGLTVGDMPISYHFTLHTDSRVYFDAAPDAAMPRPYMPELHELHDGTLEVTVEPTAVPLTPTTTMEAVEVAASDETSPPAGRAGSAAPDSSWQILLFISLGLVIGGGLHLFWPRSDAGALKRQTLRHWDGQITESPEKETTDA